MQTDVKSDVEERMLWESRKMGLLPWRYLFTSDVIAEDWFATPPGNGIMWSHSRELPKVPSASIEDAVGDGLVGKGMAEKYEDLKSDPQNAGGGEPVMVECGCNLNTGEKDKKILGPYCPYSLLKPGNSEFSRLPVSKNQLKSD